MLFNEMMSKIFAFYCRNYLINHLCLAGKLPPLHSHGHAGCIGTLILLYNPMEAEDPEQNTHDKFWTIRISRMLD